jgi:trk system potassium uptake protein TrkH
MSPPIFFTGPDQKQKLLKRILLINGRMLQFWILSATSILVYDIGFLKVGEAGHFRTVYNILLMLLALGYTIRMLLSTEKYSSARRVVEVIIVISLVVVSTLNLSWNSLGSTITIASLKLSTFLIDLLIIILFLIEISRVSLAVNRLKIHPALVFILSFLLVILVGGFLLSLPNATTHGISIVDAIFTSTSAVCVTGLIVLDTASDFTFFGQFIIMILFQIGGLGIMTFTSFFGFFFKGSYSIKNQLFLRDYINEESISAINSTLAKIILFTLVVEGMAAVLIFFSLEKGLIETFGDQVFFSVFHAISGFCNAGFSTLGGGLYEEGFRTQYNVHLIIAFTIIIGGIGFPVVLAYFSYFRHIFIGTQRKLTGEEKFKHSPRTVNINAKLVVYTTSALIVFGFFTYWIFEAEHTLKGLSGYGRFVTAFFGSVTPRTAGFNIVDMGSLAVPTILIFLILMWIGASPGSTGGGLKTTTFAVAVINTISIAKGKNRVETFNREIGSETIKKAFAVIFLSLLVISCGIFMVLLFNPEMGLIDVTFEIFSAFSTVGLSLGITGDLAVGSKLTVALIMFLGRVGTMTVMVALFWKAHSYRYKYPEENVFIM